MPARFDAHDRTSLGLAPTVLSLLGIDRARNSFVGQSIFRPYQSGDPGLRIAPLGPSVYAIHAGHVYAPGKIPAAMAARYEHEVARARRYHALERSEEHTSELQSLMRISYAVFCLKKKHTTTRITTTHYTT